MTTMVCEPCRVHLEIAGHDHAVVAFEVTGHQAEIRMLERMVPSTHVTLRLDFEGVEGAWAPFLAYTGPQAMAG